MKTCLNGWMKVGINDSHDIAGIIELQNVGGQEFSVWVL